MKLFNSVCEHKEFNGADTVDEVSTDPKEQYVHKKSHRKKSDKRQRWMVPLARITCNKWKWKSERSKSSNTPRNTNDKTSWQPKLDTIFKDPLLLNALVSFATASYCSENILFLQSVTNLHNTMGVIDHKIVSIYTRFIHSNAEYQINLSSLCFNNVLAQRNRFQHFNQRQKMSMFDGCIDEIKVLVLVSILPSFYNSQIFQNIARKSKYYVEDDAHCQYEMKMYKIRKNSNVSLSATCSPCSSAAYSPCSTMSLHSVSSLVNSSTDISPDLDVCAAFE